MGEAISNLSFWEMLTRGGFVSVALWVVVAFSVIAMGVAIERGIAQWSFVTRARALGEQVTRCLSRGAVEEGRSACERSPSPIADVFLVGYERLKTSKPEHVVTAVHRERQRVNQELRSRMWMLGTIGATAPFVGLFGTVVGIMTAMHGFNHNDQITFDKVAPPISEALIVTAVGIAVAVEAVILYNFFSQRANRVATEMKMLTDEFLELLLDAPSDSQPSKRAKLSQEDADKDVKQDRDKEKDKPKRVKGDDDGDREAA
jgi:biopolymer transport protein ExbB/TolQ